MSTKWRIRCDECRVEADDPYINHGQDILRDMVAIGRHLTTLPGEDAMDYELRMLGFYVPMWFFRAHAGHHLVLSSEYGDTQPAERPGSLVVGALVFDTSGASIIAPEALATMLRRPMNLAIRIVDSEITPEGVRVITRAEIAHASVGREGNHDDQAAQAPGVQAPGEADRQAGT